jgi:hypothetical protein
MADSPLGDFRDDGQTIEGRWESSPDGTAGELDVPITYRKTSRSPSRREL